MLTERVKYPRVNEKSYVECIVQLNTSYQMLMKQQTESAVAHLKLNEDDVRQNFLKLAQ